VRRLRGLLYREKWFAERQSGYGEPSRSPAGTKPEYIVQKTVGCRKPLRMEIFRRNDYPQSLRHSPQVCAMWLSGTADAFFCARAKIALPAGGLAGGLLSVSADADNAIAVVQELCAKPIVAQLSFPASRVCRDSN